MKPVHYLILSGVTRDPGIDICDDVQTNIAEKIIPRSLHWVRAQNYQQQEYKRLQIFYFSPTLSRKEGWTVSATLLPLVNANI